ncbi:ubiquinone/menaquinone biosynthesis methyltransferase [Auritidibacter sp. NML100628]|uniref:ubiquinone/menaquinone biosynthesis methyltransferase n=1 Tax=Auritidibacter sp. NML100628 TaxID=2170742 RepID=UPI000D73C66D|nr:ubiquinone/menaquinone biosynthesis methyltransferase [Auritidibacter sp. NML100628]PXA77018.1 ubiquinone biosynthesis protein [Auritidibacter sp. NML100628]
MSTTSATTSSPNRSTTPTGVDSVAVDEHGHTVAGMFDAIADRYDVMNLVMTWGQEPRLIRRTVTAARLPQAPAVLDLAAGTGDLAFAVLSRYYGAEITACDIAPEMMAVGAARPGGDQISWVQADAMDLPFADHSFDAVTHGYLLRNVTDISATLAEQFRVLKPGGWMAALEMSPAPRNVIKPFSTAYITWAVPRIASWITDNPEAYEYLSRTSRGFHPPQVIQRMAHEAGFRSTGYELHMFGTMAIHWGQKPLD